VGAGPGLGASLAKRFAKGGYKVALVSRSDKHLIPIQKEIASRGGHALAVTGDASDAKSLRAAFATIREKLGNPEVLLYNVSGFSRGGLLDIKIEDFETSWKTTVQGALIAAQEVLPAQVKAGKGTIIYTGATASVRSNAKFAGFAVPKHGLRALSKSAAKEFGPQGVHIAHVIVDGVIGIPNTAYQMPTRGRETYLDCDQLADQYWYLHTQPRSCWTQELDTRPHVESWTW